MAGPIMRHYRPMEAPAVRGEIGAPRIAGGVAGMAATVRSDGEAGAEEDEPRSRFPGLRPGGGVPFGAGGGRVGWGSGRRIEGRAFLKQWRPGSGVRPVGSGGGTHRPDDVGAGVAAILFWCGFSQMWRLGLPPGRGEWRGDPRPGGG